MSRSLGSRAFTTVADDDLATRDRLEATIRSNVDFATRRSDDDDELAVGDVDVDTVDRTALRTSRSWTWTFSLCIRAEAESSVVRPCHGSPLSRG
jgi:hypothetical protein